MQQTEQMEQYFSLIEKTPLFDGIPREEIRELLGCLNVSFRKYRRGQDIFFAGDPALRVGLVLEGSVQVTRDDIFGNRTILTTLGKGELFGEVFACAGVDLLPVNATATSKCGILLMDYRGIIRTCSSSCAYHHRMIQNMMHILAVKNLALNQKIEVMSARKTREKLLVFLTAQASRSGSSSFEIPFNRQELADYLSVDRSAMSSELGRMREEGLLRFHKSCFELMEQE